MTPTTASIARAMDADAIDAIDADGDATRATASDARAETSRRTRR